MLMEESNVRIHQDAFFSTCLPRLRWATKEFIYTFLGNAMGKGWVLTLTLIVFLNHNPNLMGGRDVPKTLESIILR